jgi:hypothetical protein
MGWQNLGWPPKTWKTDQPEEPTYALPYLSVVILPEKPEILLNIMLVICKKRYLYLFLIDNYGYAGYLFIIHIDAVLIAIHT